MIYAKHQGSVEDGRKRLAMSIFYMPILSKIPQNRRQAGPTLSQQVRSLIGDGNQAYVDSDLPEAIRIMQEVIRIEPRAASAWSVLAQCYEDMSQSQKALQLRIMAAHLRHDSDEWDRLARQSRFISSVIVLCYCSNKHCTET